MLRAQYGPLLPSLEIEPQGQSINAEDGYPPNNGITCCCIDRIVVSGLCCNVAGAATATLVSSKVIQAVITPSRTIRARRRSRSICGLEHWWVGGNTRARTPKAKPKLPPLLRGRCKIFDGPGRIGVMVV